MLMNITDLELTQSTIEIFGGIISLMLAALIRLNGDDRKSWKQLRNMFVTVAFLFFSEAAAYIFRGNTDSFSRAMTAASNFSVFGLNLFLMYQVRLYIRNLLKEKGVEPNRLFERVIDFCLIISLIILLLNHFTGWMYYFDENNYYHRNNAWYVYTILNAVAILTSGIMCIHYRKSIGIKMVSALLLFIFTPLIAIVIQTFIYGISITNLGIGISLLLTMLAYLSDWSKTQELKKKRSLDIVILFSIMTISMSASVVSCILSIQRITYEKAENDSMVLAHMINDGVERQFIEPIVVSQTMANDYVLKEYLEMIPATSAEEMEDEISVYLNSIKEGFGYQMAFVVADQSGAYYTYNGISKFVDVENDSHDIWYKLFLESNKVYDLDVDTDEANNWALSVFVNHQILDENGELLGVCGVGVKMQSLQDLLEMYEEKYHLRITLIDHDGLIQVSSDESLIEQDYIQIDNLDQIGSDEFSYEQGNGSSRMTKYMEDLDWYLVVENLNLNKINVFEVVTGSLIIFIIGMFMMVVTFFVITIRERKAYRELMERRKISLTDDMTGLYNRRAFEEDCKSLKKNNEYDHISILAADVNGLKQVNDTYGHIAGDELIIEASKCIQTAVGSQGKVYRTGGDEFVALLKRDENRQKDVLHTLDQQVGNAKFSYPYRLNIAKGLVECKEHPELTFDEMLDLADKQMYSDKAAFYSRAENDRRKR